MHAKYEDFGTRAHLGYHWGVDVHTSKGNIVNHSLSSEISPSGLTALQESACLRYTVSYCMALGHGALQPGSPSIIWIGTVTSLSYMLAPTYHRPQQKLRAFGLTLFLQC